MLAATAGGLFPGLLATVLSTGLVWYWLIEPVGRFEVIHFSDVVGLVLFAGTGLFMTVVADRYRAAQSRVALEERAGAQQDAENAALRRGDQRLRALIESAVDLIVVVDREGLIQFASPNIVETFGRPMDAILGKAIFEFVHPDDMLGLAEAYAAISGTAGLSSRYEARFSRQDGSWRLVEGMARNLLDDPAVKGVVINARDVTLQRRTEELFQHAQKLESVGRLAGGIAHDFNNLLTVILSGTHELKHNTRSGVPIDPEILDDVEAAGERARTLTRQLLAFARKQVVAPVALDLNDVVKGSEALLDRALGEDIELVVDLQPDLWTTFCDPGQVEQVLLNLAVNARDAMPGGGKLTIETRNTAISGVEAARGFALPPGEWVRLLVRDSGSGMSADVKAHLFEPFFTTKPHGKGTGLGLATVHGIVHQSGGHVKVASELSQGTTFDVAFPRRSGPAPKIAEPPRAPVSAGGTETVLVVEDDATVRALAVRTLRASGYDVVIAANGREVRALSDDQVARLQLLLTDVIMPGLNGREVAEELRRRRPGLPVLYVSGYAADTFDGASGDDSSGFLAKPFTAPTLLGRVREVLDRA
jgi:PAS domain S-box-containing protein